MNVNLVTKAVEIFGRNELALECGVTPQAVRKWEKNGLPRTEWTGETNHSENIERATEGKVKKRDLLKSRRSEAA